MKSSKFTGPLQLEVEYYPWEKEAQKHLKGAVMELHGIVLNIRFYKVDREDLGRKLLSLSARLDTAAKVLLGRTNDSLF
jgi:hypothetical protein